jgi:hypothetical protein
MFDVSENTLTRVIFGSLILSIAFITGCSTRGRITPIAVRVDDGAAVSRGVAFVLPKTILELQITYSLYKKKTWPEDPNGNPKKTDEQRKPITPKTSEVVLVEKPIGIAVITIPDSKMSFAFDSDALGAFTKKTDITIKLSESGFIKTTNLVVEDKAKEIVRDLAETTVGLAKFAAVAGTEVVEMILLDEITVNRQIDPAVLKFKKDGELYTAEYSDFEKAELIFEDSGTPAIVVKIVANVNLAEYSSVVSTNLKSCGEDLDELDGIPYRIPGAAKVVVSMDDIEVYSKYHIFSQAGGIAFVPISAEAFSDVTQGLEFADEGFALVKYSSKVTAQGEALSAAAKETKATLVKGAKDLRTAEIQAKLDTIKKETELIKAETALAEAIKKKKAAASNP